MKRCDSLGKLMILALALFSLAGAKIALAGAEFDYSRRELMGNSGLIIWRAADFGTQLGLCLYIDGVPVTTLVRGEAYRAILRPGHHKLTVTDTPSPYGKTRFTNRTINVAPGQNYSFTAIWDVETIMLEDGGYRFHGFYRAD